MESMKKDDRRTKQRGWPRWLTWSAVSGAILGVIHLPDTIDQLKRWWEVFEKMDTGTLLAIAFIFVLFAVAAVISWPLHNLLIHFVNIGPRKRNRLAELAREIGEVKRGIGDALERGDQLVPCGPAHQLGAKLEALDISTPSLPPPRVPMTRPQAQEWHDVLIRMEPLAEMRDLKAARSVRWEAEFEWGWFTRMLAERIANEEDASKKADALESMAETLRKGLENDHEND